MNLALPAALLLVLALPGFIFVYAYTGNLRSRNDPVVSSESMTLGWIFSLVSAIVAHALWVPLSNWVLGTLGSPLSVDIDSVMYWIAGDYKGGFDQHVHPFTRHPYAALSYFASLYIAAGVAGMIAHDIVRRNDWDRKFALLRFNNAWHYLFYADATVAGVLVTVTCAHEGSTCLYAGVLDTYDFSGTGELERIVLISAARAQFSATPGSAPRFARIPGDKFVVWCRDVNTLNIDYLRITKTRGSPPVSS